MRIDSRTRLAWLCAAALLAGPAGLAALEMPNLSGKWHLNRDASDSPDSAMRDQGESRSASGFHGGGGGGGGGMGHGRGGHHGRSASSDGGEGPADDGSSLRDALARTQTLEIRHDDPRLSITDAGGRERVLYTDGRKIEEEHSAGGTTKVRALWKDGRLEVTSTPGKGPKVVETFAVTADHSQLRVTTTFQGGRRDVTIHRVYQAAGDSAPAAPAAPPATAPAESEEDPPAEAI